MGQKLSPAGQGNLLLSEHQIKAELLGPPLQEQLSTLTAHLLLVREPKAHKVSEAQKGHKEPLALQVQLEQQGPLVLKGQQVRMELTGPMARQAHKDHKALPAHRVRRAIQA